MSEIDRFRRFGWVIAVVIAAGAVRAQAQPAEAPAAAAGDADRPWAAGVSEPERATALELYRAGNLEFAESRFAQALAKYREALRHWDHPAIRYNMAVCLINLDLPLEAKDHLEHGLAFGAGPLGADAYSQGLTYRKLLDAQLARVKIVCPEPGTQVTLDGKLLFTGPGSAEQAMLPGEHQVIATKAEYLTASRTLVLVAGKQTTYDIRPLELEIATRTVRRWSPWKPWAVLGGAGALAVVGTLSYVVARNNFASYDDGVSAQCPHGCDAAMLMALSDLNRKRSRGDTEQTVAISLFAAAGAAAIAGVVAVIANQPRVEVEPHRAQPAVMPVPGGAAFGMGWRF